MKTLASTLLLVCLFITASAQKITAVNDSLLLEYYQNQRFAEAADYLKASYPEPVDDAKALAGLAYASQMAGKLADAENYYQRLYQKDTLNTTALFNLGNINVRRGNSARAILFFNQILARDSANFAVHKQLAYLYEGSGNIEATVQSLQKANNLNPIEPGIAFDLCRYYISLQQIKQADKVITTAYQADTLNTLLLLGKAKISYEQQQFDTTITLCEKLIQGGDISYDVTRMLGASYFNIKKYKDCIVAFKRLEATKSQNELSWYYTGMSYKALNNQTLAIAALKEAVKAAISANVDAYYSEIADSYEKAGKLTSATTSYKKALQFEAKPITYYALAGLYDGKLKDTAAAITYYKKYIGANPPAKQKAYVDYAKDRITRLKR